MNDQPESKPGRVEFAPPKGAALPETAANGKPFDVVCSFRLEGQKVCLTKFGNTPMPSEQKATEAEAKPDYAEYASGVQEGYQPGMGMGMA